MMKIRFFCVYIAFMLVFSIYAENTAAYYQFTSPVKTRYTIGFSSFSGKDLSEENKYLLKSIPLLFLEGVDQLKTHTLDPGQKQEYRKNRIEQELIAQYKVLETVQKEIDRLVFDKPVKEEMDKARAELDKKTGEALLKISELKALDPDISVSAPDELEIEIKHGKNELLLDPCEFSPMQFAKDNNLDFVFYGKVEEVQGYFYIELSGFDAILKQNLFQYKEVVVSEDLYTIVPEIKPKLIRLMLGREWTSVNVVVSPDQALVFINDGFAGIGTTRRDYLKPGIIKIRVQHPDYYEQQWMAEVLPHEEKKVEISLEKYELGYVTLDSVPSSAFVYVNSVYAGTTPLKIEKSMQLKRILLKLEGYDDYTFHIGSTSKENISSILIKADISPEERQKRKRDDFYTAFGFFCVSVPFSIFLSGYATDFINNANRLPSYDPAYEENLLIGNVLNISSYVCLGISGGLFIYFGFKLYDYIKAGDRPIG